MLSAFKEARYLAFLKWKLGEARALSTIHRLVRRDLVIAFDVPPAGDYDHDLGRPLEPTEHIKLFGPRLHKYWGDGPVFVDARLVDDERHREGLTSHPLTALLERGRLAGARPCPVTALDRAPEYQMAVRRFLSDHAPLPACVRIGAADFESPRLADDLVALLSSLGCDPSRIFLVIDFGGHHLIEEDVAGFSELLAKRLNELPDLHNWLNLSIVMTGYPEKDGLKAGQSARFPRTEWSVFQALTRLGPNVLRMPVFADYALEYPGRYVTGQATPVAQIRYTSGPDTLLLKGRTTKKPNGYEVIREVARSLLATRDYQGPAYSSGDAFFDRLARAVGGPGNASTWRSAWTDHHLTAVWRDLRRMAGLSADLVEESREPEQALLI